MLKFLGLRKKPENISLTMHLKVGVKYDKDARVFVSFLPAFKIYSQGPTEKLAIEAIQDALIGYLSVAHKKRILDDVLGKVKLESEEKILKKEHFTSTRLIPAEVPLLLPALA